MSLPARVCIRTGEVDARRPLWRKVPVCLLGVLEALGDVFKVDDVPHRVEVVGPHILVLLKKTNRYVGYEWCEEVFGVGTEEVGARAVGCQGK